MNSADSIILAQLAATVQRLDREHYDRHGTPRTGCPLKKFLELFDGKDALLVLCQRCLGLGEHPVGACTICGGNGISEGGECEATRCQGGMRYEDCEMCELLDDIGLADDERTTLIADLKDENERLLKQVELLSAQLEKPSEPSACC